MAPYDGFSTRQLNDLFYKSGALSCGSVTDVRIEKQVDTIVSKLTFLALRYSNDSSPSLPERLVFKHPLSNNNDSELDFYTRLAQALPSPPIVPWYLITSDGGLILQDLRASHTNPSWPLPPSGSECLQTVAILAHVHAQWWEDSALGVTIGAPHSHESLTSMVGGIAALLPSFCDAVGDRLSLADRKLMERVFGSSLRPWLRLTESKVLTLAHGDAHTWNFLFPRKEPGPVYLIDWQLWHVDVGARDLAFLIAAHWDGERRRELELTLLRKYHEDLLAHHIAGYSWNDLWLDYRLCVVRNLTLPLIFWNRGMMEESWHLRLRCALTAYKDLNCEELI
jgi:Ecdysteroid kinase-like family